MFRLLSSTVLAGRELAKKIRWEVNPLLSNDDGMVVPCVDVGNRELVMEYLSIRGVGACCVDLL